MPPKQLIILSNTILLINRVLNIALKSSYATQSYDIIVINLMLITSGMIYHTSPIAAIYPCYPTPTINTTPTHSTRKYIKVIILLHLHIGRERTYEELYPIDYVRDSCLSLPSLLVYCNRPMFTTITRGWYWSNRTILVAVTSILCLDGNLSSSTSVSVQAVSLLMWTPISNQQLPTRLVI